MFAPFESVTRNCVFGSTSSTTPSISSNSSLATRSFSSAKKAAQYGACGAFCQALSARAAAIFAIERALQAGVHAAQPVDDALGPVEVLALARTRPPDRRMLAQVAQVADLVGELDELGAARKMRRVLDLQALARVLAQALVVGDFHDDARDLLAEHARKLCARGFRVLYRVVQHRGTQRRGIGNAPFIVQHARQRDRVVDIGRRVPVLATLGPVLVRREREHVEKELHPVARSRHALILSRMLRISAHPMARAIALRSLPRVLSARSQ